MIFVKFHLIALLFSGMAHSRLILVHTIFRHGERTSDSKFTYPTDPYKNETFYPYGNGEMTNVGKQSMYNLGKDLRKRYDHFLGSEYMTGLVDAWASSIQRTQLALQLVLASLFPPRNLLIWNDNLIWQPIAYNFLPKKNDTLLLGLLLDNFRDTYNVYSKSKEAKAFMDQAEPVLAYIREHSGLEASTPREFFFLYITLITQEHNGLNLPKWTNEIYPKPLTDLLQLEFDQEMATRKLRNLLVGDIMRKMLTDIHNAIDGVSEYKIHMYSGHDVNIVYVLKFFGLMYNHMPGYSACISIEIHEEGARHFIELHYKSGKKNYFKLLSFEDGATRLDLQKFEEMVADLEEPLEESDVALDSGSGCHRCIMYQFILTLVCLKYAIYV